MERRPHTLGRWMGGLACLAAAQLAAADRGYLPAVGPPPLRFAPPTLPASTGGPALAEPPSTNPPAPTQPAPALASSSSPSPVAAHPPAPETARPPGPPAPEFYGPPAPASLSPGSGGVPDLPALAVVPAGQTVMPQAQLFLQYFTPDYLPGTNAAGIVVPVGFVPPQPRTTTSSSASYQVTPGGTGTAPPPVK